MQSSTVLLQNELIEIPRLKYRDKNKNRQKGGPGGINVVFYCRIFLGLLEYAPLVLRFLSVLKKMCFGGRIIAALVLLVLSRVVHPLPRPKCKPRGYKHLGADARN